MLLDSYFRVDEARRARYIEDHIIQELPGRTRENAGKRVEQILDNYQGWDGDALVILALAAKVRRFEEFATRLEEHYDSSPSIRFVLPDARKNTRIAGVVKTREFFRDCYKDLDSEPVGCE
jgi:hypothetical protein